MINLRTGVFLATIYLAFPMVTYAAEISTPEKYKPAFDVKLDASSNPLVAAYLQASRSPTSDVAIKRWEAFLGEYVNNEDSIEDITDLTLLRQAHFELMRLYYQKGRVVEADGLLKKADDFEVFAVPEPSKAKSWCSLNKYCN